MTMTALIEEGTGPMRDLLGMMGQVKQLQEKMQRLQEELDAAEVSASSGGGLVTVTLTAKGAMKKVEIDPSLMKPDEKEILEDLVVAAHTEARAKAERLVQEKAGELTGGLPLPPGMKLF
jgi:DNA-binding YbaB/EbfC family protein